MGCDFCKKKQRNEEPNPDETLLVKEPVIDDIVPVKNIIGVKFVSTDQRVNYLLSCEISDIFSNVEKKLYLKYPYLQNKKIYFLGSGNIIDRDASVEQNNIKHESVILIVENEEVPDNLEDIIIEQKKRIIHENLEDKFNQQKEKIMPSKYEDIFNKIKKNFEDIFIEQKERIILLNFSLVSLQIDFNIACRPSDKFEDVEEKIYLMHPELKDRKLNFIFCGSFIDKNRTLEENHIRDGSKILILEI